MFREITIILLFVGVSGCAGLTALDVFDKVASKGSSGSLMTNNIETEFIDGGKNEKIDVSIGKDQTDITTESYSAVNNIVNQVPFSYLVFFIVLILAGWALPTPSTLWKSFTNTLPDIIGGIRGLLLFPFNLLLKLLNRKPFQ